LSPRLGRANCRKLSSCTLFNSSSVSSSSPALGPSPSHKWRLASQSFFLLLYNSYLFFPSFFNSLGTTFLKTIPCPGLNCYACPLAIFACPIGSLQYFVIIGQFPFYLLGFLALLGIFFGRAICGWGCPFGFLQDLLYRLPVVKRRILPAQVSLLPFVILLGVVLVIPYLTNEPWFSKLCPMGTLQAGIPLVLLDTGLRELVGTLYWVKIAILIFFITLAIFDSRPFCRSVCPLGAIYALFNRLSLIQMKSGAVCSACKECSKKGSPESHCPTKLELPRQLNSIGCIKCGECATCSRISLGVRQSH